MLSDVVVKVGGSLYDVPKLGRQLRLWLDDLPTKHVLLVPGGGAAADVVRQAEALDHLGEERCHWLALRALKFNAHLLAARLVGGLVIENIEDRLAAWECGQTPILDLHDFAVADEARPDHLPHRWDVTSDSLAARVAAVANFGALMLLKSCDPGENSDWDKAARSGLVDAAFPGAISNIGPNLRVFAINFRRWLLDRAPATMTQA